jgi:uncharacterized coiled-coil protein SlyX
MNQVHNIGEGRNISGLLSRNKYLIITSVVLFVVAATAYLLFSSTKYKVRVELSLSGSERLLESTIKELRSKVAIQKAINSLSFQVSYYRKGVFTRTEIYGDSLPVKFVLGKGSIYNSPTEITIDVVNSHLCKVDQNNVITDVPLYHPVKYGSLDYMIVQGPAFKPVKSQLIIKLNTPADLTERFSKGLDAKVLSSDTFQLSLNADNAQKGQDFLNKLIEIINAQYAGENLPEKPAASSSYLTNLNDSIAYYKTIANKYQEQLNVLNHIKKATPNVATEKQKLTLNVLDAIKPYLTKPNNTFVLIPDGYDVNDSHIKKLIQDFNHAQLEKQRQLQDSDVADASVYAFTLEIEPLKNQLLNAIARRDEQIRDSSQPKWSKSVGAFVLTQLNDSLAQVNALISDKQKQYNRKISNVNAQGAAPRLTVIQKSDIRESMVPRSMLVYLLALLAGLLLPVLVLTLINYISSVKRVTLQTGDH